MNYSTLGATSALVAAIALAIPFTPLQAQDTRPGIAVASFTVSSVGDDALPTENLGAGLESQLAAELAANPGLRVLSRAQLQAALQEHDLSTGDLMDPGARVQAGRLVNARYLIEGRYLYWSGQLTLGAMMFDVETTEYLGGRAVEVRGDQGDLFGLFTELAADLVEQADLPPLPGEVQEERAVREIPAEAMTLYARAVVLADQGQTARAVETYRRITEEFPQYTEAREALVQLESGGQR